MVEAAQIFSQTYPAQPESIPVARRALGEFATAAGAQPGQVASLRLASSEALTNVARHAYRGEAGAIYVTAAVVADELWVLIGDDGCGLEPRPDHPGLGLGLGLIAQVSDELSIASRAGGGTEVRMSFALAGTGPAPAGATPEPAARSSRPLGQAAGGCGGPALLERGSSAAASSPAWPRFSTITYPSWASSTVSTEGS
jgi:serine/threonine-protein kinase RsbW